MPSESASKGVLRPRNILLGLVVVVLLGALYLATSEDAQRAAELRAAELAGDLATRVVANATGGGDGQEAHSRNFINIPIEVREVADGVYQARGVGNTHLIATPEGHVVFDTGLSIQGAKQRRLLLEAVPDAPVTHVILSHSPQDHAGGAPFWIEEDTKVVAHQEYPEDQRYLKALEDYLHDRNRLLFPFMPEKPPKSGPFVYGFVEPNVFVDQPNVLRFEQGGVCFEVHPTPGAEGADNLCLWLPDKKVLLSGDTFGPNFPQFPNVFTMRGEKVRKPVEYIDTLDRLIALEPEMIVPSHQDPIVGKEKIRAGLIKMRDAVRYVHDFTIAGMNAGKTVNELMSEVELPPELALTEIHGKLSWAVKSIWEYYATWFHFDSTTELYAVPQSVVRPEIAALAGVDALTDAAAAHVAAGRDLEALHLLEIALAGDPTHRRALETRRAALVSMREDVEATTKNTYEMDWLSYRIRVTDEALGAPS